MLRKFINLFGKKTVSGSSSRRNEWVPLQNRVTPEVLCGIDPDTMSRDTIKKRLAALYKRHNNAVSSLKPELREEAAQMLDAIVECRERYIDID